MLGSDPALEVRPAGAVLHRQIGILQFHVLQKNVELISGTGLKILHIRIPDTSADHGRNAAGIHNQAGSDLLTFCGDNASDASVFVKKLPESRGEAESDTFLYGVLTQPFDEEGKVQHSHIQVIGLQMVVQRGFAVAHMEVPNMLLVTFL